MQLGNNSPLADASQQQGNAGNHINFSTPAGWAMFYFVASIVILGILFFTV